VAEALPHWVQIAWFALLLVGGSAGLLAGWLQGRAGHVGQGLRIEGGALCFLAGGALLYSLAMFVLSGMNAFGSGTITCTYGVACLLRLAHVGRDVRAG
jgi:hypothetical protein